MMEGDTKLCSNCKKEISAANFVMHEMHCRRHITLCEHCGEPIPRVELDQHFNDVHAKVPCERCRREIARNKIENHMETECSKKPMSCEFCELTFPRDEYGAHNDYCGSRTECCSLCQQYIMLKDRALHEASDCMYPEPKPVPAPQPINSDPFSMAHFQDFLDVDSQFELSDDIPDFTANLRQELQRFESDGGHQNSLNRTRQSRIAANTSNRSNVNVQRLNNNDESFSSRNNPWEAIPPDLDYDSMLALQLAHEDWAEDGGNLEREKQDSPTINEIPDFEETSPPSSPIVDLQPQENQPFSVEDGDLMIPCEFCYQEFPMSTYIDHAETCPLSDQATSDDIGSSVDRNNEVPVTQSSSQRNAIPVINNLRSERLSRNYEPAQHWDSNTFVEDVILPCEFCEEMFPSEIIVQHQSVCPANGMATPRVTTPAAGLKPTKSKRQTNASSNASFSTFGKSSRSAKQRCQPDPEPIEPSLSDDDGPQSNFFRDSNYKDSLSSTSDKYSPAVDRFDDSVTRPPRRSSRQLSSEDSQENTTTPAPSQRPNKSAQRARASLNQLLQEDNGATAAAARTSTRGSRKTQRGRPPVDNQRTAERRGGRGTQVSSRTVMRELDRAQPTASGRASRQTRSNDAASSPLVEANSRSTRNNISTNRQNRDQIFSPELRLKPDHNPPRRVKMGKYRFNPLTAAHLLKGTL